MSGVDITDQQLAYNSLQHRMLKCWKKVVLCNLLEITMANANFIYKKLGVGNYNNDTFRLAIIEGLLEGYDKPQKNILQTKWKHSFSIGGETFCGRNPNFTTGGRKTYPDCEVCSNRSVEAPNTDLL